MAIFGHKSCFLMICLCSLADDVTMVRVFLLDDVHFDNVNFASLDFTLSFVLSWYT